MRVTWLRKLLRERGALAVPLVAAFLLFQALLEYRRRHHRTLVALVVLILLFLAWLFSGAPTQRSVFAPQAAYTITDLGALPNSELVVPYSVNDRGQVAGYVSTKDNKARGFFWQNGRMQDIGTLGGDMTFALGLNEGGQVVGMTSLRHGQVHAFLWQNGKMQDIGTLGGEFSIASAINARGQIAGGAATRGGEFLAALWQDGKAQSLGKLPDTETSQATGINIRGTVVGVSSYG